MPVVRMPVVVMLLLVMLVVLMLGGPPVAGGAVCQSGREVVRRHPTSILGAAGWFAITPLE
ncbi:MAG: hypothetical protein JO085_07370 [Acidimicrobiia bacterium]|nr:hypothetical protein [Acidimicrobiia bacterium]